MSDARGCPPLTSPGVTTLAAADGDPIEHVLTMRRLPDDRRLSLLVEHGDDVDACLRTVARIDRRPARTGYPLR